MSEGPIPIEEARKQKNEADKAKDGRPPAFSDDALARTFAEKHRGDLRHVGTWGRWLSWDGTRWRQDETYLAFDQARQVCREAASICERRSAAVSLASAKTIAAVERLAKADRRLAATTDQWDQDPWLLNTPAGIVDLRTGNLRRHDAERYMTKITAAAPGGDCPRWLAFLGEVTGSDKDLQAFLQRMAGYCLSADTAEHALFFLFGHGGNGKSVFVDTLAGVLGGYHRTAPIETFTASHGDRHPTDLAMLQGARLVTATETEEGRRWAEAKIKALTGGDKIAARFMRQDFFEYQPQFKLVIAGNHRPGLRSVDEAIRRRFNLIPFSVTIPPSKRDLKLTETLRAEWPGILRWAIQGCTAWQQGGLRPPQAVTAATDAYLEGEDAVSAWIEECCERHPDAWESSAALFASWKAWAEANGEPVGSQKRLAQALEAQGLHPKRTNKARGFEGLMLKPSEPARLWD